MSALPQAVRKQIERANQLVAQANADPNAPPADNTPPAGDPPGDNTPPANGDLSVPEWEQRYRVLQGKYNSEVPRLLTQAREQNDAILQLRDQLTATQNLLGSLSVQQRGQSAAPLTDGTPATVRLVKDEEIREFGDDLIDVMRRVAREEGAQLLPEIDRRVAPVAHRADQAAAAATQVGKRVQRREQLTIYELLDKDVPKWREVNQDDAFVAWLDEVDPYSGHPRGAMLKQAYEANDGPRVVNFFLGYQQEHAAVTPPAGKSAAAAPVGAPRRSLDTLVAPGTPKAGAASTQDGSGKRIWTRAEIGQFYAEVGTGRFKGTADQRKQLEADIFAAQREGRIR
jgi:hypothetical protein